VQRTENIGKIATALARIADAVSVLAEGQPERPVQLGAADAYLWDGRGRTLVPVPRVNRVPLALLRGIDHVSAPLLANTIAFARGHGANNALLWGARGMGKSSLVKAIHADVTARRPPDGERLILVEINREDLETLPVLLRVVAPLSARFILFCDDLSFDRDETSYKSLKTVLDGGLEGRPSNVVFYATSNRRHLMPRDMIDNERATAINPGEAVEEKVSLSDRFGLWLGFHHCDQPTYLEMVRGYASYYRLPMSDEVLVARAIEWSATRGARSGRVAIQLVRQLAGEAGLPV